LLTIMGTGGWVLEKARRFKSNGRVLGVSPLNDLIEREGLLLGVHGKAAGFRALRLLADTDARLQATDLDELIERAEQQADTLEQLRGNNGERCAGGLAEPRGAAGADGGRDRRYCHVPAPVSTNAGNSADSGSTSAAEYVIADSHVAALHSAVLMAPAAKKRWVGIRCITARL